MNETSGTTFTDFTGNGHDGTINGSPALAQAGLISGDSDTCVLFDGTNDEYDSGTNGVDISTGDWTLEAWIFPTAIGGVTHRGIIGAIGQGYAYMLAVTTGLPTVTVANVADATPATTAPTLNTISHVAATFVDSSNLLSYYLNGQPNGSNTFGTAPAGGVKTGTVGTRAQGASFFQGNIDEAVIYQTALSATSVLENYQVGIQQPSNLPLPTAAQVRFSG